MSVVGVEDVAAAVVDAAYRVHVALGPGLLESAYHRAMAIELRARGYEVKSEVPVKGTYRSEPLGIVYRCDLLIEGKVVVEIKSVERTTNRHRLQVRTYLRLTGSAIGFLINFDEPLIKDGLHRIHP